MVNSRHSGRCKSILEVVAVVRNLVIAALIVTFSLLGIGTAHASTIHTVLPGETLWRLGNQHQMPLELIRRNNNLPDYTLNVGQFLRIPQRYQVKSGDTLWLISQRYGIGLGTIRHVNNVWDSNLRVGQVLYLPTPVRNQFQPSAADRDLFERLVSAEAKGEPFAGQVAVANVVLNRVMSRDFSNTIPGVIMETYGSIPAFSPVANGEIYRPAVPSAKEAVRIALLNYDYSIGSLFFYNPRLTSPNNWIRSRTIMTVIGNHAFAW